MNGTKARRIAAVERYIHDLAIALADIPADEREDVIAGVREHIEDSLTGIDDPAPEQVEQVLTSLGDPAEIAADARDRSGPTDSSPQPQASRPVAGTAAAPGVGTPGQHAPLLTREWVPIGVMGLFILAAFATWLAGPGSPLGVLFWLGGLAALVASPLWSVAERVVGALWFGGLPIAAGAAGFIVAGTINVPRGPGSAVDRLGSSLGPLREWAGFGEFAWLAAAGIGLVGLLGTVVIMAWLVTVGTKRVQR